MLAILIQLTANEFVIEKNRGALTLEKLLGIIDFAKDKGGVGHKKVANPKEGGPIYEDQKSSEIPSPVTPEVARIVSRIYQRECEACGIYSGRGDSSVGSRLTFVPDKVRNELEAKNNNGKTIFSDSDLREEKALTDGNDGKGGKKKQVEDLVKKAAKQH